MFSPTKVFVFSSIVIVFEKSEAFIVNGDPERLIANLNFSILSKLLTGAHPLFKSHVLSSLAFDARIRLSSTNVFETAPEPE